MPNPNAATLLAQELEPHLLELLRTHLDSFLKWDVMRLFHTRPHLTLTAAQIARELGRDVRVLEPALAQLVRGGLLEAQALAEMTLFTYTDDEAIRAWVGEFFTACQERRFRVLAIYAIIRTLR